MGKNFVLNVFTGSVLYFLSILKTQEYEESQLRIQKIFTKKNLYRRYFFFATFFTISFHMLLGIERPKSEVCFQ